MSSTITLFCALFCCFTARGADSFDRLSQINKASIVMLAEKGIVPKPMAAGIVRGIQVMADEAKPGAERSGDDLIFEAALLKVAGPNASRLHSARISARPASA